MKYKHRNYSNKLLVNVEWKYLRSDKYDVYKNVGLGIIKYFDSEYKPNYNIPKLREKYKLKKNVILVKHNSPEKMLAICSLGKVYKVKSVTTLECDIAKKLSIENLVCSTDDSYYDDGKGHKCKLCNSITRKIASHLTNHHKMTSKQYYDKYLKKENEGICVICGKPTRFLDARQGYLKTCSNKCAHASTGISCKKTFKEKYNVDNISQLKETKEKVRNTNLKNLGVTCPFKSKVVRNKSKEKWLAKYNVDNPLKSSAVLEKVRNTNLKNFGVTCVFESERIKNKIKETNRNNCGHDYWHQLPEFQEVVKKNNLEKWGVEYPNQTEENRKRVSELIKTSFPNRRKKYDGFLSKEESIFDSWLNDLKFDYEYEYRVNNHTFDFAVFKNNKLDCLIDIDGEFWHGILTDLNGAYDHKRYSKVPIKVKYLVIDSLKIKYGIKELVRMYNMSYSKWKKDILSNMSNLTYPKYDEKHLVKSWKLLCNETKFNSLFIRSNVGKSIIINFCPKYAFKNLELDKNKLFYSPLSSKHPLEGYDELENIPMMKKKYSKYKNYDTIVVKHHSPEKMLAICSLGKTYVSKEHLDKGSLAIINFLHLNAYVC